MAEAIARAVREGDLTLARALLDAQGKASPSTPAEVIELAAERAKRS